MIVASFVGFTLFILLGLWVNHNKSKRTTLLTWNEIAGRLRPVQSEGIQALAMEQLQPADSPTARNQDESWDLIGGATGLACMSDNAEVFIELVSYAERVNPSVGIMVADRMRQDGLALRRAVFALSIARTIGYGRSRMSAYAQDAASSYYLMRERLLAFYKNTQGPFYPVLEAALQAGKRKP